VGENLPRQADVRLVCATCRDLPRLVAEGGFRQDLYYRINGACLSLPTVKARQDLPELIHHLLAELATDDGLAAPPPIEALAFEQLLRHPWPGNVRQLKTALRHGLILSGGGPLRLEHLPGELAGRLPVIAAGPAMPAGPAEEPAEPAFAAESLSPPSLSPSPADTPRRTLRELEAERLRRALEAESGNLSRVARQLGIARSTLYRRLRKHGFLVPEESP
jgi:transcriptional regulator of acetoin/glycerol metabolism